VPWANVNVKRKRGFFTSSKANTMPLIKLFVGNNYTGQQISNFFVPVMNILLIYLFASIKLEKGHKKITWL